VWLYNLNDKIDRKIEYRRYRSVAGLS